MKEGMLWEGVLALHRGCWASTGVMSKGMLRKGVLAPHRSAEGRCGSPAQGRGLALLRSCTHVHVCPVGHPARQLLRREAAHLQLVGVPALGLPLGREVNESGGRVHVQLQGESSHRIQPMKGLFSDTILCHFWLAMLLLNQQS